MVTVSRGNEDLWFDTVDYARVINYICNERCSNIAIESLIITFQVDVYAQDPHILHRLATIVYAQTDGQNERSYAVVS